jgi:hypothetical protein
MLGRFGCELSGGQYQRRPKISGSVAEGLCMEWLLGESAHFRAGKIAKFALSKIENRGKNVIDPVV